MISNNKYLFFGTIAVPIMGAGFAFSALVYASGWTESPLNFYSLWLLLPYIVILIPPLISSFTQRVLFCYFVLQCGISFAGPLSYFYSLFIARPDAQGALIFLGLPAYQLMAAVPTAIISAAFGHGKWAQNTQPVASPNR